jgi:glycosyltransferase involved in cell wall biosynthesis
MKILFLNSYGIKVGGTETTIKELKTELQRKGHEVRILTSDFTNGKKLFADYTFKNVESNFVLKLFYRLFNPYSYIKLKQILTEYNPDIVHLHRMDLLSPSVLFLLKKTPAVLTIHGPEDFIKSLIVWFMPYTFFKEGKTVSVKNLTVTGKLHYFFHTIIQLPIYRLGLRNINLFISPSQYFSKLLDKNIQPVITVPNGIKLLDTKEKSIDGYNLLFLGRLDKFKGIEYIIFAMPQIIKHFPNTKLSIVGEGNYKVDLSKKVKQLDLEKKVRFVPWLRTDKIHTSYESADIVLMPSIWPESFGKVGVEAMSVGRPVIASRVGGIPEWLQDTKTGFLVEPGNSEKIAEKVILLFTDRKLLRRMGKEASIKAQLFSIEKHTSNILKVYNKLLNTTS